MEINLETIRFFIYRNEISIAIFLFTKMCFVGLIHFRFTVIGWKNWSIEIGEIKKPGKCHLYSTCWHTIIISCIRELIRVIWNKFTIRLFFTWTLAGPSNQEAKLWAWSDGPQRKRWPTLAVWGWLKLGQWVYNRPDCNTNSCVYKLICLS